MLAAKVQAVCCDLDPAFGSGASGNVHSSSCSTADRRCRGCGARRHRARGAACAWRRGSRGGVPRRTWRPRRAARPGRDRPSGRGRPSRSSFCSSVVDAKRAVEPRRAEAVPLHRVRRCRHTSRIDNQRLAAECELERELVVVSVSAAPLAARVATADDDVRSPRAEDVVAAVRVRGACGCGRDDCSKRWRWSRGSAP